MGMYTQVLNVTPEMAKEWLGHNPNNRRISKQRVQEYAQAMLDGHWNLTHQGIAFDEDGNLIDGQHRLIAVAESGCNVPMNVTTGVHRQDGYLLEIDVGRNRSYKNIVDMAGIKDRVYGCASGIVRAFLAIKMNAVRGHVPSHVVVDYIERHYNEISYIAANYGFTGSSSKSQGTKHSPAIVAAAALSALYGRENRDAIAKFGQVWTQNDTTCTNYYNVKVALDCREKTRNMRNSPETLNYVENCIRCFANNITIVRMIDCYKLDPKSVL